MPTTEPLHTLAETATILGISQKLLREHVRAGNIRFINAGTGKVRKHMRFTEYMIERFLEKRKEKSAPCQSISTNTAPIGKSNSTSTVLRFESLQKPKTSKKH